MHIDELEESLDEILPSGFEFDFDRKGRLIIRTTLVQDEDGELTDSEEEVDEDSAFDDDTQPLEDEDEEDD